MKVVLIWPTIGAFYVNPLGLMSLGASIRSNVGGAQVQIVDLRLSDTEFCRSIFNSDVVALSVPVGTYPQVRNLLSTLFAAKSCEEEKPTIVLGGNVPTIGYREIFDAYPRRDLLVVVGEGEQAITELLIALGNKKILSDIPNLVWFDGYEVVSNRRCLPELSSISYPPLLGDNILRSVATKGAVLYLETTRGCHHTCSFCFRHRRYETGVRSVRYFPMSRFEETLHELLAKGYSHLTIKLTDECVVPTDPNIPLDKAFEHVMDIISCLHKQGHQGRLVFETRIDSLWNPRETPKRRAKRRSLWHEVAKTKLDYVVLGLESCSDTQLKRYGKGYNVATVRGAMAEIEALSLPCQLSLILFDPLMTLEELQESLAVISELDLLRYTTSLSKEMRILRGTPYWVFAQKAGIQMTLDQDNLSFCNYSYSAYKDPRIGGLIPYLRAFYSIFNDSGYRFAGIQMFLNFKLVGASEVRELRKVLAIPQDIRDLELAVLNYLVSHFDHVGTNVLNTIGRMTAEVLAKTRRSLNLAYNCPLPQDDRKILNTMMAIMGRIENSLGNLERYCEEAKQ